METLICGRRAGLVAGAALLVLTCACASCALRFRGQEAVSWAPLAEVWVHYPPASNSVLPAPFDGR